MARSKSPSQTFWKDDLGLNLEELIEGFDDDTREAWIDKLNGRRAAIVCEALGLDGHSTQSRKESLRDTGDELVPYYLVERFARFKSKVAALEVAHEVLPEERLGECMTSGGDGDTSALLLAIYVHQWDALKAVALLDRTHKSGFAGMRLIGAGRKAKRALPDVLKPGALKAILTAADKTARDRRTTVFRGVLDRNGRLQLFMRRAERPDQIVRPQGGVIHGFKPEWIILDFEPDAKRVRIASRTGVVPIQVANRIALACFEKDCHYVNDSDTTPRATLQKFLAHLRADGNGPLVLVELTCKSAPLKGSPALRLSQPDSRHLGSSLNHFEQVAGKIPLDNIDSVKVLFRKKRVTIIIDNAEDGTDAFDVRYSDHRLNRLERDDFVTLLRETHGITIHSTEKQYARSA